MTGLRHSLFTKYLITLFVAVVIPLILGAAGEAWFGYRAQRAHLDQLLKSESRSAAERIGTFVGTIRDQLGWVVQLPWTDGGDEQHRSDALRLLRQVPAISSMSLVNQDGIERVYVSRLGLDRMGPGADMSSDPAIIALRAGAKTWFGPVRYLRESEPYMTIAVAGNRASVGYAIADVNLKFIWDVVTAIRIGETGEVFVVNDAGRLIAHPDISLVLRGDASTSALNRIKADIDSANGFAVQTQDVTNRSVVAVSTPIREIGWTVIALQPTSEAFAPLRAGLWRAGALVLAGTVLALLLAYALARRISGPIRQLEEGARRVGAGQLEHRITISTGDELERLAARFNDMTKELGLSKEKSDRINRLKRFLAPQVAEIVDNTSDQAMLDGQRREVAVVFGDLRDFTAFSSHAAPDVILGVLAEYYQAVGAIITRYEATLTSFAGDGLMVLVNAPVKCADPALHALRMAIEMQVAVQAHILRWRAHGHAIGFGMGVAMGPAIVGTIGYEGRLDYTAIGSVVNLASRLCGSAGDGQILVDSVAADAAKAQIAIDELGTRAIKGYDEELLVFSVAEQEIDAVRALTAAHAAE